MEPKFRILIEGSSKDKVLETLEVVKHRLLSIDDDEDFSEWGRDNGDTWLVTNHLNVKLKE